MKLLFLIGSPREAIALGPIIRAAKSQPESFDARVCVSGRRPAALDAALAMFEITPDRELSVSAGDGTPAECAARLLEPVDQMLAAEKPECLLVHGDASTALVGSLAAYYRRVQIAHVEAGVRTYDKYAPFPEEMNRRVTDLLADIHFAPTEHCQRNLIDEGFAAKRILVTGSTGIDALHYALGLECELARGPLAGVPWDKRVLLVSTNSRDAELPEETCNALRQLAETYGPEIHVVYVSRLDPDNGESLDSILGDLENVTVVPPLDYRVFVHLLNSCHLVLTDAGGIQEEACCLGKPVLLLGGISERLEGLAEGAARLVGTVAAGIVKEVQRLLDDASVYEAMARPSKVFGDGRAAERICYELLHRD